MNLVFLLKVAEIKKLSNFSDELEKFKETEDIWYVDMLWVDFGFVWVCCYHCWICSIHLIYYNGNGTYDWNKNYSLRLLTCQTVFYLFDLLDFAFVVLWCLPFDSLCVTDSIASTLNSFIRYFCIEVISIEKQKKAGRAY